jgi:hypothetical protein
MRPSGEKIKNVATRTMTQLIKEDLGAPSRARISSIVSVILEGDVLNRLGDSRLTVSTSIIAVMAAVDNFEGKIW